MSERQQILVPGIHVADTVTCRSCATLALLQTDAEADPPCLHAASIQQNGLEDRLSMSAVEAFCVSPFGSLLMWSWARRAAASSERLL